jgi:hypothetical protein
MGGGNQLVCQVLSPLSRLLKRLTPGSGPLGCLVWSLGALWASGTCGSRAGDPRAAAVFPRLSPAPEFADLGADYSVDAEVNERGSTSVRWVSGSGTHESFCLALWGLLGLWRLWFRAGVLQAAAVFPWFVPDPGIHFFPLNLDAVLVHSSCGWRVWQVAPIFPLCGRLLALLRVQLLCHKFVRSRGYLRRVSPIKEVLLSNTTCYA